MHSRRRPQGRAAAPPAGASWIHPPRPCPTGSGLHNFTREVPKRGARTLRATFGLCPALAHRPWGPVPGGPLKKVVNLVDEFAWTAARPHAPGATLLAPS